MDRKTRRTQTQHRVNDHGSKKTPLIMKVQPVPLTPIPYPARKWRQHREPLRDFHGDGKATRPFAGPPSTGIGEARCLGFFLRILAGRNGTVMPIPGQ